jgi:hypothetical protein
MKIKTDFVTNSSTTSYIMLGYSIKVGGRDRVISLGELRERAEKLGYQLFEGDEMGAQDNNHVLVGEIIGEMNSENYGFKEKEIDFNDLVKKVKKLKEDLGLPETTIPKVICTTRVS